MQLSVWRQLRELRHPADSAAIASNLASLRRYAAQ